MANRVRMTHRLANPVAGETGEDRPKPAAIGPSASAPARPPHDVPLPFDVDPLAEESPFRRGSLVWAGISLAVVFWFLESYIHVIFFHGERFHAVPQDTHEFWMRAVICALFIGFGFYSDASLRRYRKMQRQRLVLEAKLAAALAKVLSGFLPICAHCKRIRDQNDRWLDVESFVHDRTAVDFTHGICPECASRYYSDITGLSPVNRNVPTP